MKVYFTLLFTLLSAAAWCQKDSTVIDTAVRHATYERHSTMATISTGFVDAYRQNYTLPAGFEKGNTSGFDHINAKLEYGFYKNVSLAATFGYDAFVYNFKQDYTGNTGAFTRNRADVMRIFSGGVTAFYHLRKYIHVRHLDPVVGLGLSLNNIRHSNFPQGDSTVIKIDHTVSPYLKAGARYYISSKFSLFGDIGFDQQYLFSVGFSCRFFTKIHGI